MLSQPNQGPVTIDAVMGLLRDGAMRRFRIDIEVDSTITGDESQEKQDRTEFLKATTEMVTAWAPILMQKPDLINMFGDLLLFGVRGFNVGRELEESIEETIDKMEDASSQPPPPNPQMMAEQAKLESVKVKSQAEIQKAQIGVEQTQTDAQAKMASTQAQAQLEERKHHLETQRMLMQFEHDKHRHELEMHKIHQGHSMELERHKLAREAEDRKAAFADREKQAEKDAKANEPDKFAPLADAIAANTEAIPQLAQAIVEHGNAIGSGMSKPRKVVRGPDGKVMGVE